MTTHTLENYEFTFSKDGRNVLMTFDLQDVGESLPANIASIAFAEDFITLAFETDFVLRFKMYPGLENIITSIRGFPSLYVAALGRGGSIDFSQEIPLAP